MAGMFDDMIPKGEQKPQSAPAYNGMFADMVPQKPAEQPKEEPRSFMQSVGDYARGIKTGMYRVPQSVVKMGAQGLDALGVTEGGADKLQRTFDMENEAYTGPPNKMTRGGDVIGQMLATAPVGALKAVQGAGWGATLANSALQGGTAAALTSSASDAPLGQQVATGAGLGAAAGAAQKAVGGLIGNAFRGKAPPAPTTDELRSGARAAYQQAENAGVIISKPSWRNAVSSIRQEVIDEGLHPGIHPKANAALGALEQVDDNLTLEGAERLRRIVTSAGKSIEPDERRLAGIMKDKLDDYLSGLNQSDVIGGDPQKATTALREARDMWSRMSKGDFIEGLVERAGTRAGQFSGSGFENAMRTEFRQVALNPKKMRRFTAEEQAAIKKVAEGGPIGNAMRWLGKFAPRGVVSTTAGQMLGGAVGGPMGAYAAPVLGEAGRFGATQATSRNAAMAAELMRRGGSAPVMPPNPQALAIANALRQLPAASVSGALAGRE